MILEGTDKGLITKENCAVVFIDHQPQMVFGVASSSGKALVNNVKILAKAAKVFNVPTIITTVEEHFSGKCIEALRNVFPDIKPIQRSGMNSWDSEEFRNAIKATGKKNIIVSGLWTEVCVCWPTLAMLDEGYNVFVAVDACGGLSKEIHDAAIMRMMRFGAVPVTSLQMLFEFQRDWARKETYDAVINIVHKHSGTFGIGVEYAKTMVFDKH